MPGSAGAADEQPSAVIRLLLYQRVGEVTEVDVIGVGGKVETDEPVPLPVHQLSPPISVVSRQLAFRAPASEGEDVEEVKPSASVAIAKLPSSGSEFLLMFLPAKSGSARPYVVQVIPFDSKGIGSGAFAFLNYSGSEIGGMIGKRKFAVANGKMGVCQPSGDEGVEKVLCYERDSKTAKWSERPFFSSRLAVQKGVRNFVIVTRNPKTNRVVFRGVPDFLPR